MDEFTSGRYLLTFSKRIAVFFYISYARIEWRDGLAQISEKAINDFIAIFVLFVPHIVTELFIVSLNNKQSPQRARFVLIPRQLIPISWYG